MNREEYEEWEDKFLAPYALKSKFSRGRRYPEEEHNFRTCFQRDRDRIVHSTAFRRLEYKTQVFLTHEGDYYRTRLTHSLEVAQIARSIARILRLNADLVEAIALGHDMGHTPFGHSGEEALNKLMQEEGGFNHNLQGLRIVDYLERRYPEFPGLNLTWEVKEGLVKHSTRYDSTQFSYQYGIAGLEEFYKYKYPTLEAQVVNVADEIAYDNHDLDDGITSGLISEEDLRQVPLWEEAELIIRRKYANLAAQIRKHQIIRILIDMNVKDIIAFSSQNLAALTSAQEVRQYPQRLISFSKEMEQKRKPLRDFLYSKLYNHYRVVRMADKSRRIIEKLFQVYINKPTQLPVYVQSYIEKDGVKRAICDYIASMTDRFAQEEYRKLFDPLEKV